MTCGMHPLTVRAHMRYSLNVSILFTEVPFLERFARARDAGFTAVEFWWPRGEDLSATRAAIENVRFAADAAAEQGAEVLIEAVNTIENGPYLLWRTDQAADFARSVGRDNVRLQYDAYHMQRMEGNLVATIERHFDAIAHVQIADSPGRGQPGTGEINFDYVLGRLGELGYDGHVGLEYKPPGGTPRPAWAGCPASCAAVAPRPERSRGCRRPSDSSAWA